MSPSGYTVEITNLSSNATEKDVHDFLAFCGAIQHIEIVRNRAGECASSAYVTFRNPHAVETALLVTGATILDQAVCITQCGHYENNKNHQNRPSWNIDDESTPTQSQETKVLPSAGGAMSLAKQVAAKGYGLGKNALGKAKAFDESHQVSATAVAKVAGVSDRIGLTDKLFVGVEAARSVDQRYRISGKTKLAVSATRSTAVSAANAVVSSSYFSKGAFWLSGALNRASQAAADLGSRGVGSRK